MEEEINKYSTKLDRDARYLKTSKISRLPAYLSINLIRFFYKEKNAINAKILKDVKFSLTLDMYELCTPELQKKLVPMRQKYKDHEDQKVEKMQQQKSKTSEKPDVESGEKKDYYNYSFEDDSGSSNTGLYQLYAVLTHKGRSSSSGHYVGWIKHKGKYYRSIMSISIKLYILGKWFKCDDDQVYQVSDEEILKLSGGGDWHCAYVLLYGPQLIEKCKTLQPTSGQ